MMIIRPFDVNHIQCLVPSCLCVDFPFNRLSNAYASLCRRSSFEHLRRCGLRSLAVRLGDSNLFIQICRKAIERETRKRNESKSERVGYELGMCGCVCPIVCLSVCEERREVRMRI